MYLARSAVFALVAISICGGCHKAIEAREQIGPEPVAQAAPSKPTFPPKAAESTPFGAHLGIELPWFRQIFPEKDFPAIAEGPDGQISIAATVHGLEGDWHYAFKAGRLDWVLFNDYVHEIHRATFDACLAATDAIIADYTERYGPPASVKIGRRTYEDPHVVRHWGYDVMQATWKADGMKFRVDFDFMGGKGEYALLVQMEFEREDYPYF